MENGNGNIFIILRNQVPIVLKIKYANPVCDYLLIQSKTNCVGLTLSGNKLPYPSESGSPAATIMKPKILFNVVILTPSSQFICADIKECFL